LEYVGGGPVYHTDAIASVEGCYDHSRKCWKVFTGSWDKTLAVWFVKGNPPVQTTAIGIGTQDESESVIAVELTPYDLELAAPVDTVEVNTEEQPGIPEPQAGHL
jgi:hypothetical protein